MKKIFNFKRSIRRRLAVIACCVLSLSSLLYVSCDNIYDNIKEFSVKEIVYPAHFDTIYGSIGYECVEIDLSRFGRIPSSQMNLGKAKKTIVEYGKEVIVIDSVCSWVKITGLSQPNIYRFMIYTADEFDNRSTPVEIALTPYTVSDQDALTVSPPKVVASPWAATMVWPSLSSVILDCYGLSYSYTDKDGTVVEGAGVDTVAGTMQLYVENLEPGVANTLNMRYKVVPKVNAIPILDTVFIDRSLVLYMPTIDTYQQKLKNRDIQSIMAYGLTKIKITWANADSTLRYTTMNYTDYSDPLNPVGKSIQIPSEETETTLEGLKAAEAFTLTSTYAPRGANGVLLDADPILYTPHDVDYDRSAWTSTQSHARPSDSPSPVAHLDGNTATFLSLCKPGKSTGGASTPVGDIVSFIVDMGVVHEFSYYRIRHRDTGVGLRVWALSIYGSNDGVNFSEIEKNIDTPSYSVGSILETPNVAIPLSRYRYIKVVYEKWDPVNNSAMQMAEFYLGIK